MKWDLEDIVTSGDLAKIFRTGAPTITNWATRDKGFPKPLIGGGEVGRTTLYSRKQALAWYRENKLSPEVIDMIREED